MENHGLDVLSKAALLVEKNSGVTANDTSYKRMPDCDPSRNCVPSKYLKHDELFYSRDSQPVESSGFSHSKFARKCISTQTSLTGLPEESNYPEFLPRKQVSQYTCLTPVSPYTFPMYHRHPSGPECNILSNYIPLNLSNYFNARIDHLSPSRDIESMSERLLQQFVPYQTTADNRDQVEEHFRRSLGEDYFLCRSEKMSETHNSSHVDQSLPGQNYINQSLPCLNYINALTSKLQLDRHSNASSDKYIGQLIHPISSQESSDASSNYSLKDSSLTRQNITVAADETVDDHFSKSLGGQTWSKLKVKDSVDEHFRKALGDTWLHMNDVDDKEGSCDSSMPGVFSVSSNPETTVSCNQSRHIPAAST